MSAPYIIPFNFQPVATVAAGSTYTVPSGKFARVVATLTVSALVGASGGSNGAQSQTNTGVFEYWLKAGDVITVTGVTGATSGGAVTGVASATVTAEVTINGTTSATVGASASYTGAGGSWSISGARRFEVLASEYNQIS